MRYLKTVIIKQGGSIDIHFLLAECYRKEGNYEMAAVEYRYCLNSKRRSILTAPQNIREKLVECYLLLGRDRAALLELLELERTEPSNYTYLFEIAKIFYDLGNIDQAVIYFDRTVKANSEHAESLSYLGMIMYHTNQFKEATRYLARAIRQNNRDHRAFYYLGRLYMDGRDFARAITYFDAAQRSPEYRERCFLQKGHCYREMNEIENAIDQYQKAIAAASGKDQNLFLATKYALAALYESKGKLTEAMTQWEDINKLNDKYRDVSQKLEMYSDLRADDNMKDFLVSPLNVFEGMCIDIVRYLGYNVAEMKHIKRGITSIIANPQVALTRHNKTQRILIKIFRDAVTIGLQTVKKFLEESKEIGCTRSICISPLRFTSDALSFSTNRQIVLLDGKELSRILTEIRKGF